MTQSRLSKAIVLTLAFLFGFGGLVLLSPSAQAATWTQTSDTDFNADTLVSTEVVGTGAAAYVRLSMNALDWKNESPSSGPSVREGPAMAYDSVNNVVVLFGGYDGTNLGDTWEYDPSTNAWTLTSSTGPSGRAYAALAADSGNGVVVLFGGISDLGPEVDTWEYNAATNSWTQTTPANSPPAVGSYTMAYDATAVRTILVGLNVTSQAMETWSYNAGANTWTDRAPSSRPTPRTNHAVAYHAGLDRVVLFGGFNPFPPPGAILGDTWEYNYGLNGWTRTLASGSGPSARFSHALSYRPSASAVYMFGGNGGSLLSDTWRYRDIAGTRTWTSSATQTTPPARFNFGLADEASNGKSVMFGGVLSGGVRAADTWSLGPAFQAQGTVTSTVVDSGGANADWQTIAWSPTSQPVNTTLRFQLASSSDPAGPWNNVNFVGPDGSTSTYYTTSGATIVGHDLNRYMKFRAFFTSSTDLTTPTLDDITITYDVPPASPYIVTESPTGFGVSQTTPIFIRFSETMDKPTVTWTINPALSVSPSWSEGDSALTLDHTAPMDECRSYTVTITAGKDLAGNTLVPGPVPNPWTFTTQCINPQITSTSPSQGAIDVLLTATIIVDFSEPMNTSSVSWSIGPTIGLSGSWSNGDTRLSLTHVGNFPQCTDHTVTIDGKDLVGLSLIPGSVPNPWSFMTICTIPFIVTTSPAHLEINVAVTAPIVVTFSKPMDTPTVRWSTSPTVTLTPAWSNLDKTLTLTHGTPLTTCTPYTANITAGKDLQGNDLFPTKHESHAPHPWKFETTCASPFIVFTVPADGDSGVDQLADITVQFSKAMNTASVSWTPVPPIALTPTWVAGSGDTLLRLSHTAPFPCGTNTMQIAGQDLSANPLVTGLAPNPWSFTPLCPNPLIVSTSPADGAVGVRLNEPIVVTFSKPMDTASLSWSLVPGVGILTPSWSNNDTIVRLDHATLFSESTRYTASISGSDKSGNPLIAGTVPNPWRFTTVAILPFIVFTSPADRTSNVPVTASIDVNFSESMDTATVRVTTGPFVALNLFWSNNNTSLAAIPPSLFAECTAYTVTVTGNDTTGNPLTAGPVPNPWGFSTVCTSPYIVSTAPTSGATEVPNDAPITVTFSEAMDRASVGWTVGPSLGLAGSWSAGDTVLTLVHSTPFAQCTPYTVTITGRDLQGKSLISGPSPNPWTFTSFTCNPPYIVSTSPSAGAIGVPLAASLIVTFNAPMNRSTVSSSVQPSVSLTSTWSNGNRTLTLAPNPGWTECTRYIAQVAGKGENGLDLGPGPVPNPWSFTAFCLAPFIVSTNPGAAAINVPVTARIVVIFSEPMIQTSLSASLSPGLGLTATWSNNNQTVTLDHTIPFAECTVYTATIGATDVDGNNLVSGPVPNPWSFTAVCPVLPPGGLRVTRLLPNLVHLQWNVVPNANSYRVYESRDRFATWPWTVLGTSAGTTFDTPQLVDTFTHYYIVRAVRSSFESANSTMGVKAELAVGYNPAAFNVHWVSLPYRSEYATAIDISNQLTSARIDVIGKWNPLKQTSILWYLFRGQWRGTNFAINPGDGLWIGSTSAFSWSVVGTDRPATLPFTLNPPAVGNLNWISLPYTSRYRQASDLVLEIEGSLGAGANTKIVEVAKWDGTTQSLVRFYWTTSGWTGTDFAISAGDAISVRIVSTFAWQPNLLTPEVP